MNPRTIISNVDLDRRALLKGSMAGLAVLGTSGVLSSCASGGTKTAGTTPAGKPKRGGTLHLGASGGATTDTLDGQNPLTNTDANRSAQLFDPLVWTDNNGSPALVLAKAITPNATGTEWTIEIHPGVKTHQGKNFTADDVLFSLRRIVDNKFPSAFSFGPIDLKSSRVMSPTTLKVAFTKPYAIFLDALSLNQAVMVPRGFDPKKPDGTGPFKFQSFTPGVSSTFVRNENYWRSGLPYLDAIVTTNIDDETSQVGGLQSGQLQVIDYLSQGSTASLTGGAYDVIISNTGGWGPFTMRVDRKPFDDVRIRQALRLVVDRKQMLEQVFGGKGKIGNDVFGIYDKDFPSNLPQREQDIPQAKSLLKAAGQSALQLELVTTPSAPGMIPAAQVFAAQAKQAGIQVKVTQQTLTAYFANSYLKTAFSQDYWATQPFLVAAGQAMAGPSAPFSATHFNDPQYNALYTQAIAELDASKRKDLTHQLAKIDYDRGANIIPYFFPVVNAQSKKVGGIMKSASGFSPGGNDFAHFYLS